MGRIAITDTENKEAAVYGTISQYMKKRQASSEYMAKRLGITEKTFCAKMKNPGSFSVKQLAMISNILQVPQSVNFFVGVDGHERNMDRMATAIVAAFQRIEEQWDLKNAPRK